MPPRSEIERVPVIYWLSGLTCNEQNFMTKAGAQQYASHHNVAVVIPDTSPRKLVLLECCTFKNEPFRLVSKGNPVALTSRHLTSLKTR